MAAKVAISNVVIWAAGSIGLAVINGGGVAFGYFIGYTLGSINLAWLYLVARKGARKPPHKAGRYVAAHYYVRFIANAIIFGTLISKGVLNPWPSLAGLSAAIFTTVGVMAFLTIEEVLQ